MHKTTRTQEKLDNMIILPYDQKTKRRRNQKTTKQ
jgi:hypothetical protein